MRTMSTAPASIVYPRTLDADVQAARFTPAEFWLDVTLDSVLWIVAAGFLALAIVLAGSARWNLGLPLLGAASWQSYIMPSFALGLMPTALIARHWSWRISVRRPAC